MNPFHNALFIADEVVFANGISILAMARRFRAQLSVM